jgi:hypothetical protein
MNECFFNAGVFGRVSRCINIHSANVTHVINAPATENLRSALSRFPKLPLQTEVSPDTTTPLNTTVHHVFIQTHIYNYMNMMMIE